MLSSVSYPAAAGIGLYVDQDGSDCTADLPPLMETTRVYLIVTGPLFQGYAGVQFKLSMPACAPYEVAAWAPSLGFLTDGNLESGMQVAFGGCVTGDFVVMSIDLVRTGDPTTDCCPLRLTAHPTALSGMVEALDCSTPVAQTFPLQDYPAWLSGDNGCAQLPPPSDPLPPDGATDVPLNTALDCVLHPAEFLCGAFPLGSDWVWVYFGTNSNPPLVGNGGPFPFTPDILAPGTTYYWKVDYEYFGVGPVSSPVWSFTTTTTPNDAEASTWGAIKALYRR